MVVERIIKECDPFISLFEQIRAREMERRVYSHGKAWERSMLLPPQRNNTTTTHRFIAPRMGKDHTAARPSAKEKKEAKKKAQQEARDIRLNAKGGKKQAAKDAQATPQVSPITPTSEDKV